MRDSTAVRDDVENEPKTPEDHESDPAPAGPLPEFAELGLCAALQQELVKLGFERPTPIQKSAVPVILRGDDVLGIAQTGTGKTAAFILPILERLGGGGGLRSLVLSPTRELTTQIHTFVDQVGGSVNFRAAEIIGGEAYGGQNRALASAPDMVVGTPGRVLDQMESLRLPTADVEVLVLDEADRLLDMGFAPQIEAILRRIPKQRQTMLFSATMPARVKALARKYMHEPVEVAVGPRDRAVDRCTQELFVCSPGEKIGLLKYLLREESGTVLVFTRTKRAADLVGRVVERSGHEVGILHADRRQSERRQVMADFRAGRVRVLVATDIASRGLDVEGIARVVNYDVPPTAEDYLHRIGRTARAEREGHASTFATGEDLGALRAIEARLGQRLPSRVVSREELHAFLSDEEQAAAARRARRNSRPSEGRREEADRGTRDEADSRSRRDARQDREERPRRRRRKPRGSAEKSADRGRTRNGDPSRASGRDDNARAAPEPKRRTEPLPARRKLRGSTKSRAAQPASSEERSDSPERPASRSKDSKQTRTRRSERSDRADRPARERKDSGRAERERGEGRRSERGGETQDRTERGRSERGRDDRSRGERSRGGRGREEGRRDDSRRSSKSRDEGRTRDSRGRERSESTRRKDRSERDSSQPDRSDGRRPDRDGKSRGDRDRRRRGVVEVVGGSPRERKDPPPKPAAEPVEPRELPARRPVRRPRGRRPLFEASPVNGLGARRRR